MPIAPMIISCEAVFDAIGCGDYRDFTRFEFNLLNFLYRLFSHCQWSGGKFNDMRRIWMLVVPADFYKTQLGHGLMYFAVSN